MQTIWKILECFRFRVRMLLTRPSKETWKKCGLTFAKRDIIILVVIRIRSCWRVLKKKRKKKFYRGRNAIIAIVDACESSIATEICCFFFCLEKNCYLQLYSGNLGFWEILRHFSFCSLLKVGLFTYSGSLLESQDCFRLLCFYKKLQLISLLLDFGSRIIRLKKWLVYLCLNQERTKLLNWNRTNILGFESKFLKLVLLGKLLKYFKDFVLWIQVPQSGILFVFCYSSVSVVIRHFFALL